LKIRPETTNEAIEQRYELWEKFLARFPLEKLNSISLEENSPAGMKQAGKHHSGHGW
jgi:hypothetical protein